STGLINMNARLYDPVLGRFLSADTIVPSAGNMQDFNRYAYVLNNPLAYTDPSGHSWWTNVRDTVVKPVAIAVVAVAVFYLAAPLGTYMRQHWGLRE
ncbi:MAG: RHS repeat-associated core domain-containing protein, partial [Mariprofundaceae bacterium]|nr:RHS repeat-associated core domain-containing protein [Mariprofundaceae bacterium]